MSDEENLRIFLNTCRILTVEKHQGPGGARIHTGLMGADGHTDLTDVDQPHNHPNPPVTHTHFLHSAAADSTAAPPKMPVSVQKHRGEPVPRVRVPVPARAESRSLRHMGCFSISAVHVEELVKFKLLHKQQTT
jgi:hypothetical protein